LSVDLAHHTQLGECRVQDVWGTDAEPPLTGSIICGKGNSTIAAHILLSGIARITGAQPKRPVHNGDHGCAVMISSLRNRNYLDGERKLMFAVLEDGVQCYLKNMDARSRRQRILFFEVRDWMKAGRNNGPFSFELLCQEFGTEGSRVRNALESKGLCREFQRVAPTWIISGVTRSEARNKSTDQDQPLAIAKPRSQPDYPN
jgi:hypothetical protein